VTTDTTIRRIRAADATLTLTSGGTALAHHDVVVAQRSHSFLFGCTGFEFVPLANDEAVASDDGPELPGESRQPSAASLAEHWLDLFNFATLPFYWGWFEPTRGRPDTTRLRNTARWFTQRGCVVKGHPLAWHTLAADWLLGLTNEEIVRAQVDRIHREVTDFGGLIDMWDVINEVVIMPTGTTTDSPGSAARWGGSRWSGRSSTPPARPTHGRPCCSTTSTCPRRTSA